jgi:hypothetical protein
VHHFNEMVGFANSVAAAQIPAPLSPVPEHFPCE